jgi:hypothetical protein
LRPNVPIRGKETASSSTRVLWMVTVNAKVGALTGVPVAVFIAFAVATGRDGSRLDFLLAFALTVILCAIILGVPQGYLVSVAALRRGRWQLARLAGLLAAMQLVALVTPVVAFVAVGMLTAILPPSGHWSLVPGPPAKAKALLEPPRCLDLDLVVQTEDSQLYGYRAGRWTVEVDPSQYSDDCPARSQEVVSSRSRTPLPPRGEVTRLVVQASFRECGWGQTHYVLGADASLWRWAPGTCDPGAWEGRGTMADVTNGSYVLSFIFSFVAWSFVAIGDCWRARKVRIESRRNSGRLPH